MKKYFIAFFALFALVGSAYVYKVVNESQVLGTASAGPVGINGLRAYAGPGIGEVTLEWARASLNTENYSVHYGTGSGFYQYLASHVGNIATYTVKGLTPGTRYYFGLERIWTGDASQGISGEVVMTAPSTPVTVIGTVGPVGRNLLTAVAGPKAGQVTLKWKKFYIDTTGYNVSYGDLPGQYIYGATNAVTVTDPNQTDFSFTISALKSGHRYYFAISPIRASIGGSYITAEVSTVTP